MTQQEQTFTTIFSYIFMGLLLAILLFTIVCWIMENKRKQEYIEKCNTKEKSIIAEFYAIECNPFKPITKGVKNEKQTKQLEKANCTNKSTDTLQN